MNKEYGFHNVTLNNKQIYQSSKDFSDHIHPVSYFHQNILLLPNPVHKGADLLVTYEHSDHPIPPAKHLLKDSLNEVLMRQTLLACNIEKPFI